MDPSQERFLSFDELRERVPYTRSQFDRMEREQKFPQRVELGPGRIGWALSEVLAWMDARKAERQKPA